MIEVESLVKRYGSTTAVDGLSFAVRPGVVTGFLGPNGAGKTTTMRIILGLESPDAGTATVNGRPLRSHRAPLAAIGALLDARAVHPRRSARDHLRALAATNGIAARRADEVLDLVGLADVGRRPAGSFSLGMGQRLGIAAALLGDPAAVMLDEPVNGLDPEGIISIRALLNGLADEGRTVLVSSHLMSEMALTADRFVIIGRGRLIADLSGPELARAAGADAVTVRSPLAGELGEVLAGAGASVAPDGDGTLTVAGLSAAAIGERAAGAGIVLHELTPRAASLEDVFLDLTAEAVDFRADPSPGRTVA